MTLYALPGAYKSKLIEPPDEVKALSNQELWAMKIMRVENFGGRVFYVQVEDLPAPTPESSATVHGLETHDFRTKNTSED
jgi:hypothetical protein